MGEIRADLHVHSYYSDGVFSPEKIAELAEYAEVNALSLTDHDTMLGCLEAKTALSKRGIIHINGIEISAYERDVKLHTLGYNLDPENSALKEFLRELYENSLRRADDIITKLNKNGVRLTLGEVLLERKCDFAPVHGMYIARAAAKKGYATTPFGFYSKYMTRSGCGYSDIGRPTPEKAIEIIREAGGVSSLAHPGRVELDKSDLESLIKRLKRAGLCGIECNYPAHTYSDTAYFKGIAKECGLIVTGGSDMHYGDGKRNIGQPNFVLDSRAEELLIERKNS